MSTPHTPKGATKRPATVKFGANTLRYAPIGGLTPQKLVSELGPNEVVRLTILRRDGELYIAHVDGCVVADAPKSEEPK